MVPIVTTQKMGLPRWVWWQQRHGNSTHLKMKWCLLHESLNFILHVSLSIHGVELLCHLFFQEMNMAFKSFCEYYKTMSCLSLIKTYYSGNTIHVIQKNRRPHNGYFQDECGHTCILVLHMQLVVKINYISSNILFTFFIHLHIIRWLCNFSKPTLTINQLCCTSTQNCVYHKYPWFFSMHY